MRFRITYYNRSCEEEHLIRKATSALEAIEKVCTQYGWKPSKIRRVDADTRGRFYATREYWSNYGCSIIEAVRVSD